MAKRERWYFTEEELMNSPSRKCGIDPEKELSYRQQAANLIQDMGQKLKVNQLVINTAIVYMHRFYTFHSFSRFHRNTIASCALFLAAKVEEQHRKLEHVIKVSQLCLFRGNIDTKSEHFQSLASELVYHENLMLRTLGFDLNVQHPHTAVVNCFEARDTLTYKDLAQASYIMATNSLHLTTLCLRYKPTVVACICIHFVCKWACFEISKSSEGKDWWTYIDPNVTPQVLDRSTAELINIFKKCPSRLKKILNSQIIKNPNFKQIPDSKRYEMFGTDNHYFTQQPQQQQHHRAQGHQNQQNNMKTLVKEIVARPQINTVSSLAKRDFEEDQERKSSISMNKSLGQSSRSSSTSNIHHQIESLLSSSAPPLLPISSSSSTLTKDQLSSSSRSAMSVPFVSMKNLPSIQHDHSKSRIKSDSSVISSSNKRSICNNNINLNSQFNNNINESNQSSDVPMFSDSSEYSDHSNARIDSKFPDLKMEFSENEDSNPSDYNLDLNTSFIMNETVDEERLPSDSDISHRSQPFNYDNRGPMHPNITEDCRLGSQTQSPRLQSFDEFLQMKSNANDSMSIESQSSLSTIFNNQANPSTMFPIKSSTATSAKAQPLLPSSNFDQSTSKKLLPYENNEKSLNFTMPPINSSLSVVEKGIRTEQKLSSNLNPSNLSQKASDIAISHPANIESSVPSSLLSEEDRLALTITVPVSHKKHKEKHKHKEKKHKEKHKHKHKSKSKEHHSSKHSFKLPEDSSIPVPPPIKLKISRNMNNPTATETSGTSAVNYGQTLEQSLHNNLDHHQSPPPAQESIKLKINLKKHNVSKLDPHLNSSSDTIGSGSSKKRKYQK
ncbi:Cyclin N-like protein [Sarcoptes scabiei]|uniref:Cyclin N-like protein n=1 Tax=Sarcoptes scabiei TaxID=52283 RepID=A0A132A9I3_SARSC|nr:Cyclin N-like protein [Sarcoptes scabiei]